MGQGFGGPGGFGGEDNEILTVLSDPNDPNSPLIEVVNVNLNAVPMNEVILYIMEWSGKTVIPVDDVMNTTITVFSAQSKPIPEALQLIYKALGLKGYGIQYEGKDIIYIKPK